MKNELARFLVAFYKGISGDDALELVSELSDPRPLVALISHRVGLRITNDLYGGMSARLPLR